MAKKQKQEDSGINLAYREDSVADRAVLQQVLEDKCYALDQLPDAHRERVEAWLMHGNGEDQQLILDAGANIGASATFFAVAHPAATIIAVEPDPENYRLLQKNANLHAPRIVPVHGAVSCSNGTLYLHDPDRGEWGYQTKAQPNDRPVLAYSVPDLIERYAPGAEPFLAKIDIEGGEAMLFRRDADWVAKFPLLIVEIHDWMEPRLAPSRNLLKTLVHYDFDVLLRGENLWCLNNDLL